MRKDHQTGEYRTHKGSGPVGIPPAGAVSARRCGHPGTAFEQRSDVRSYPDNYDRRMKLSERGLRRNIGMGRQPHPTKRGPGRF